MADWASAEAAEEQPLLTDFGVAHVSDALAPGTEQLGKPHYIAPERVVGGAVDCRADIFAMGTVLYRLLTGLRPFEGDGPEEILQQVASTKPSLLPELESVLAFDLPSLSTP
jgi:eukaryotic-like serine/threonine-protein kinase